MKRMIDDKLIKKIADLDVEELTSAVEKANNSLQLPEEAPATDKMVVINDEGEQELQDIPQASGGTQLYKHTISYDYQGQNYHLYKNADDSVYITKLILITTSPTPCSVQSIMGANRLIVEGNLVALLENLSNNDTFFSATITGTKVCNLLPLTLMSFNTALTEVNDVVATL